MNQAPLNRQGMNSPRFPVPAQPLGVPREILSPNARHG